MTLEQTINADAASKRLGISAITARQRWAESHFMRTSIISRVLDLLDMARKDEVSHYLRPSKIKADNITIRKVVNIIRETMNPFDELEKDHLYNIATGKAASAETADFVLKIDSIGDRE